MNLYWLNNLVIISIQKLRIQTYLISIFLNFNIQRLLVTIKGGKLSIIPRWQEHLVRSWYLL